MRLSNFLSVKAGLFQVILNHPFSFAAMAFISFPWFSGQLSSFGSLYSPCTNHYCSHYHSPFQSFVFFVASSIIGSHVYWCFSSVLHPGQSRCLVLLSSSSTLLYVTRYMGKIFFLVTMKSNGLHFTIWH